MGSRQPAVLLREIVNVERCGEERRERLSTGRYTLVDISCRGCCKKLGWHYLCAISPVGHPSQATCSDRACIAEMHRLYIHVDASCRGSCNNRIGTAVCGQSRMRRSS